MAQDPQYNFNGPINDEEYRRRAEAKAKRRKKRQMQRLALLGGFALAAILLIVAIVMFFRSIFGKDGKDVSSSSVPPSSISVAEPEPVYAHPVAPDPTLWSLMLVNVQKPLAEDFSLADDQLASIVQGGVAYWFDTRIVDSLNQMIADCNAGVEGGSLAIVSGYRSANNQNGRFTHLVEVLKGQGYSDAEADILARQSEPPAGFSEHQIGLAVDFVTGTVNEASLDFASTPEFQWLTQNAANYGFILRYPSEKESITGVTVQPYHWRYVGVEEAKAISGAAICLEEYVMAVSPDAATPESTADPVDSTPVDASAEGDSSLSAD